MAEPRERPILFSGPMVRAILDGRKTQTRRILKSSTEFRGPYATAYLEAHRNSPGWASICPYGQPGDRLWVRETWGDGSGFYPFSRVLYRADGHEEYAAACRQLAESDAACGRDHRPIDGCCCAFRWRPSIHMPRWASRLTLEVVEVRIQRLHEISEEDARAEGVTEPRPAHGRWADPTKGREGHWSYRLAFQQLWDAINGERAAWESKPWTWCITFKRVP